MFILAFLTKGKIKEENLESVIQNLKDILNDKYLEFLVNNENWPNEFIKNLIINGEEKNLNNVSEVIDSIKFLFLNQENKEEKNINLINDSDEDIINKIFENWKNKYNILKQKVQQALGHQNDILKIEKEIGKYKDILENKRKEISKDEEKCYNKYIDSLSKLLIDVNVNNQKFETIKENFKNYLSLIKNNLNSENKDEYFHFPYYIYLEENKEVNYNETNSIIFFENIELASPSILEALIPFFDKSISKFLLPFGQEGKMKKYNIILSYDPSRINLSFQNFFPPQIYNNSLIFKMQNPSTNDYYLIFNKMTYDKEYSNEKNNSEIINDFITSKNYTIDTQAKELISLNDLKKYDLFRNQMKSIYKDNDLISEMIFTSRFSSKTQKLELFKKLGYKKINLGLKIEFYSDNDNADYSSFSIF